MRQSRSKRKSRVKPPPALSSSLSRKTSLCYINHINHMRNAHPASQQPVLHWLLATGCLIALLALTLSTFVEWLRIRNEPYCILLRLPTYTTAEKYLDFNLRKRHLDS